MFSIFILISFFLYLCAFCKTFARKFKLVSRIFVNVGEVQADSDLVANPIIVALVFVIVDNELLPSSPHV
jgi:hypothetical protein